MQDNISISNGKITGTLKFLADGAIPAKWGEGYFLALKFSGFDSDAEKVLVGLNPSVSSGLVDILPDPDKNGVFKVTNKDKQRFEVKSIDGLKYTTQFFDLSELELEETQG